jgi:hypothetical protein
MLPAGAAVRLRACAGCLLRAGVPACIHRGSSQGSRANTNAAANAGPGKRNRAEPAYSSANTARTSAPNSRRDIAAAGRSGA